MKKLRLVLMKNMSLMNWTIFLKTSMPMNKNTPQAEQPQVSDALGQFAGVPEKNRGDLLEKLR